MGYADEVIIKRLSADKCRTEGTIQDGMIVREEKIEFEKYEFFDSKLKIMLPINMQDLPPEVAKIKYPMEQRPPIIKTTAEMDMDFTFNLAEQRVDNEQIDGMVDQIKKIMKKYQPSNVFFERNTFLIGEKKVAWFDFLTNGFDGKIYNLSYFISVDGRMFNGVFNCEMKKAENWKPVVLEILKLLEFSEE